MHSLLNLSYLNNKLTVLSRTKHLCLYLAAVKVPRVGDLLQKTFMTLLYRQLISGTLSQQTVERHSCSTLSKVMGFRSFLSYSQ
jgi:hypothetical protein